jgi:thioredoxin-related protein
MKLVKIIPVFLLMAVVLMSLKLSNSTLSIGDKAPMTSVKMKAVTGEEVSLEDLKQENGLLVIFSCNTCPFVLAWEDQYPKLGNLTSDNDIGMVLVNSNEAKRKGDDAMSAMKEHASKAGYNCPYVVDEGSKLADAFGAQTTPHVYLFNEDMELVYRGSINDKFEEKDKTAKTFYLEGAIKNLIHGKKIDPADTREIGCSIKRVKT